MVHVLADVIVAAIVALVMMVGAGGSYSCLQSSHCLTTLQQTLMPYLVLHHAILYFAYARRHYTIPYYPLGSKASNATPVAPRLGSSFKETGITTSLGRKPS